MSLKSIVEVVIHFVSLVLRGKINIKVSVKIDCVKYE
jgi:hypothetical protein